MASALVAGWVAASLTAAPVPFKGGTLVPSPILLLVGGLLTDGAGGFSTSVASSGPTPVHVFVQCLVKVGGQFELSNALDCVIGG